MKTFAFVFARGGSKGLPKKNIKKLLGIPLIEYSIMHAKKLPFISEIFVSTDDKEIAEISKNAGARIIKRPFELASDKSAEWLSWQHAITKTKESFGSFENFISLPATSPLRSSNDIERAYKKRLSTDSDVCLAITPSNRNPYFNMVSRKDNSEIELLMGRGGFSRRQDVDLTYDITTVVYVSTPEFILSNTGIFDGTVTSVEVPKERAIDIDDIYDFNYAESVLNNR